MGTIWLHSLFNYSIHHLWSNFMHNFINFTTLLSGMIKWFYGPIDCMIIIMKSSTDCNALNIALLYGSHYCTPLIIARLSLLYGSHYCTAFIIARFSLLHGFHYCTPLIIAWLSLSNGYHYCSVLLIARLYWSNWMVHLDCAIRLIVSFVRIHIYSLLSLYNFMIIFEYTVCIILWSYSIVLSA